MSVSGVATAALAGATGAMVAVAWQVLWRRAGDPAISFGGDLVAYIESARRLTSTGSPYHPAVLAGPVENIPANVPIGYFYPPPLAQLFVPLAGVPHATLAWTWFLVQVAVVCLLVPALWLRGGGRLNARSVMGLLFLALSSQPLAIALYGGNVSGWIAIGIAMALLSPGALAGLACSAMAVLKSTPAPLLLASLADPQTRRMALVSMAPIVGASIALAPVAWTDWLRALPSITRNPPGLFPSNLSPAAIGTALGIPTAGYVVGIALALGFGLAGIVLARRGGLVLPAISGVSMAYLFVSPSLWDHYTSAVVPLIIAAWPTAGLRTRVVFASYVAWGVIEWTAVGDHLGHQVGSLLLLVAVGVTLVVQPPGDTRRINVHPALG